MNALRGPTRSMLVITHYQRLLDHIVPDFVHVLSGGRIVKSGDKGLALELEEKGYGWLQQAGEAERQQAEGKRSPTRTETATGSATRHPERHWSESFGAAAAARAGEPAWLEAARKSAIARFAVLGFPTRSHEEWKYTNPAPIAKVAWTPAAAASFRALRSTRSACRSPKVRIWCS